MTRGQPATAHRTPRIRGIRHMEQGQGKEDDAKLSTGRKKGRASLNREKGKSGDNAYATASGAKRNQA